MSNSLNQATIVGNIGREPKLSGEGDKARLEFSVATSESWGSGEDRKEQTEWHNVKVWGKRAAALAKILSKGEKLAIVGKLQTSSWVGKENMKHYRTEIIARDVVLLGGKRPPVDMNKLAGAVSNEPDFGADDIPF